MAELGAFWGAGKKVVIFLADQEIGEPDLPSQFKENLWTRDARRVLETIKGLNPTALNDILTPDLVLLLRYLERDNRWVQPDFYGKALAVARGEPGKVGGAQLRGWERAVRYCLLYLSYHGLVQREVSTFCHLHHFEIRQRRIEYAEHPTAIRRVVHRASAAGKLSVAHFAGSSAYFVPLMNCRTGPDTPLSAVSIENTSDTWL